MEKDVKKKEDRELREYMKREFMIRTATAVFGLVLSAAVGYFGKKSKVR